MRGKPFLIAELDTERIHWHFPLTTDSIESERVKLANYLSLPIEKVQIVELCEQIEMDLDQHN